MLPMKKLPAFILILLFFLSACVPESAVTPAPATASPFPTAAPTLPPAPASPGDSIIWDSLRVTMDQLETTQDYLTDYGSTRVPPAGPQFLWVHVRIKNTGQADMDVPLAEHFSILYAAIELKPTYGHRQNYTDYTTLGPVIFPDQELEGWLRFDIPAAAERKDLRFVFIPESAEVGTSYDSPNYPYAENKPTSVWTCAP